MRSELLTKGNAVFFINLIHRLAYTLGVTLIACLTAVFLMTFKENGVHTAAQYREINKLCIIYTLCTVSYFILQGSDPGYISKGSYDDDDAYFDVDLNHSSNWDDNDGMDTGSDEDEAFIEPGSNLNSLSRRIVSGSFNGGSTTLSPPGAGASLASNSSISSTQTNVNTDHDNELYYAYCNPCQGAVPIRAHHCQLCNRCVAR